jgi:cytochrome oxidase Cu insertion factor (SCO1/SenC/PrrC family)
MKRLLIVAVAAVIGIGATLGALLATRGSGRSSDRARAAIVAPAGPFRGSEPPPGIQAPDFSLRSYRGPLVRMRDLRGKVVLVTFLDTGCRDKCPIIAAAIGRTLPLLKLAERAQVVALAVSVLPQLDTPARVESFLRQRHALAIDWLIGPAPALVKVWKEFSILAAAQTGNANSHSADVRVFDRSGIWVSTLHVGVDLTPANLAHDIRLALRTRA